MLAGYGASLIVAGYAAATLIGYLGYRARALTASGAVAACLVGGTIFGFGGWQSAVLLVLFFATSSVLSFLKEGDERKSAAASTFEKGGRRDAMQVAANGGVAAVAAVTSVVLGDVALGALLGALGAATADTWATEIGVLSRAQPRMVTTGKVVVPGTSGGVTWLGSGSALLGAATIGLAAALLYGQWWPIIAATFGGFGGMLADSVLGATVQASYYCPNCAKPTEARVHRCGTPTVRVKGLSWVNNDLVNVGGTAAGGLLGAVVAWLLIGHGV